MTNFTNAGNNVVSRITFNSGYLDFGNSRIVQMENITITTSYTLAKVFVLNSIKPQDLVHHTQTVALTAQMKSFSPEVDMLALGSSSIGVPNNVITLDGQPTFQNPVVTLFDRNGKEIQYQFTNMVFKSTKASMKMEDYTVFDVEAEAMDIIEVYTA